MYQLSFQDSKLNICIYSCNDDSNQRATLLVCIYSCFQNLTVV